MDTLVFLTCWTNRTFLRSQFRFSFSMGRPSSLMLPDLGLYHRSINPIIVLFPEPDCPWEVLAECRSVASRGDLPLEL